MRSEPSEVKSWLAVNASVDVYTVQKNVAEATTTNGIDMGDDVNMYAIEFETDVQQGVIRIPSQYRARVSAHVKVILIEEQEEEIGRRRQLSSFDLALDSDVKKLPDGFYQPLIVPTYTMLAARDEIYDR